MIQSVMGAPPAEETSMGDSRLNRSVREFEGMLLSELLRFAKDDSVCDGALGGSGGYEDFQNQAVANAIANAGGIGIADLLIRNLDSKSKH